MAALVSHAWFTGRSDFPNASKTPVQSQYTALLWRRLVAECRASGGPVQGPPSAGNTLSTNLPSTMDLISGALNNLFSYKPFFRFATGTARNMIVKRGTEIGYPWAPELATLRLHNWEAELHAVETKDLEYPHYYMKPFHAYEQGNLSWEAALEAELAAKAVHANVFDPERKILDPEGDSKLRDSYHDTMCAMLKRAPTAIVDIGCATGLSTFRLHQVFPNAEIVGVDLSPFFLSVANFRLKNNGVEGRSFPVNFLHAAGEYTGLQAGSFDLVSLSLVCHELPRSATKQIVEEANRLLKIGGVLAIMEMNPYSPHVQRMVNNVFAFTAFKSTEPYFDDYRTFQIEKAIQERGFTFPQQVECSPRHRTIVAFKR
ncbi:hypothetical protein O6H91_02G149500 [Diphasiastrum complanatum]|uniref:Uncharacterized protein n=1 Tax=Diphasiastrum complanatum TaxID=34168 RepID=A0ACC2ELY9_DIPCM|nr:hypothetical protein O6H91_02G149500 [Diphasiastrum complanatum]